MPSSKVSKRKKPKNKGRMGMHAMGDRSARDMFIDKMKDSPEYAKTVVFNEPPGVEKMSEVLMEYAEPLTTPLPAHDDKAFRNAIGVAAMCWNAALSPKELRKEGLNQFVSSRANEMLPAAELREILNFMVERKNRFFRNNKRWILDYSVTCTKKDRHVQIASTLEPKQMKNLLPVEHRPWWKRLLFWIR